MICVSLREKDYHGFLEALPGLEMAEIRLDGADLSPAEIIALFSRPLSLMATFRPREGIPIEKRTTSLALAVRSGARLLDLELESPPAHRQVLIGLARDVRCRVIISYHNDLETPGSAALGDIVERCFAAGADIAKIACRVRAGTDCARILSLYQDSRPIVALGMGGLGTVTRVAAPFLGAPFTYAALDRRRPTAEGQLDRTTMEGILKALGGI